MTKIKSLRVTPTPAVSNHTKFNAFLSNKFLACDLFSLRCGDFTGEIILNSTCFDTRSYMGNNNPNEIYVYVDSSSSKGIKHINAAYYMLDFIVFGLSRHYTVYNLYPCIK